MKIQKNRGFTLIEMMVSMVIGLFLVAGVFTVFINSRESQRMVEDQVIMIDNARMALELISYDLRHAGLFGRVNEGHKVDTTAVAGAIGGDCEADWAIDVNNPVRAFEGNSPYVGSCTASYYADPVLLPDVLEMRYTLGQPVVNLQGNMVYVNSDVNNARYFIGASPAISPLDFQAVAHVYYISNFTDDVNDGFPSLRRAALEAGPIVNDQLLMAGVRNIQVQLGIDTDDDLVVNSYVNPSPAVDWSSVVTVQVWLVVQSMDIQRDLDTSVTFNISGQNVTYPNDGFRKAMVTKVIQLRNAETLL